MALAGFCGMSHPKLLLSIQEGRFQGEEDLPNVKNVVGSGNQARSSL